MSEALKIAMEAAEKGSEVLMRHFGTSMRVQEKSDLSLVSEADSEAESVVIQILKKYDPKAEFVGEEGGVQEGTSTKGNKWIIDPLDGTTNFVHGFPYFGVSIALEVNGVLEVGVVKAPAMGVTFYGRRGQGSYMNEQKMSVSTRATIEDSLLATGFAYGKGQHIDKQVKTFSQLIQRARGIRRPGAAALDLCYVACGVFDGFWERHLRSWDMAAGALLVQEAGGIVSDLVGNPVLMSSGEILASNKNMYPSLLAEIKKTLD